MKTKERKIRPEKRAIVHEIRDKIEQANYVYLLDFTRINMEKTNLVRQQLRETNAQFHIVKNKLFRQAIGDSPAADDLKGALQGQTAMVSGEGDAAQIAKLLKKYIKDNQILAFKGGLLEEKALDADQVEELAELPAKPVMQAILLGVLAAPMRNIAGVLHQKLASVVYVLKAYQDKKEQGQQDG